MSTTSIYNATDGPLAIDRAGRQLGGRETMPVGDLDVEASPLSGHIEAERMALVELEDADEAPVEAPADKPTTTRKRASSQEA